MYVNSIFKKLLWVFLSLVVADFLLGRIDFPRDRLMIIFQGVVDWVMVMSVAGVVASGVAVFSTRPGLISSVPRVLESPDKQNDTKIIVILIRYLLITVGIGTILGAVYVNVGPARHLPIIIVSVGFGAILFLTLSVLVTVLLISFQWFLLESKRL